MPENGRATGDPIGGRVEVDDLSPARFDGTTRCSGAILHSGPEVFDVRVETREGFGTFESCWVPEEHHASLTAADNSPNVVWGLRENQPIP